jgi:phospholipid/cholesterol/gamma-HCH transport system substrate-binding protein
VDIEPGSAEATLVNGAEITNTQGAVDLFGLIGRAMRPAPAEPRPGV